MNNKQQVDQIVLFDGICNFCSGIVTFIIKRDKKRKFRFSPLQSQSSKALLKQFNIFIDNDKLDTFIYIRNNKVYIKSTAALYVLKDIGKLYRLLFIFIVIPGFLRNFFYSLIANSRYKIWGKKDECLMPTPEIKDRFL